MVWRDPETNARAWLVINSSRGGAAGGGTRMRSGATLREATVLAKVMELKFAFSGPAIAGAKTGIDFDPSDPRKAGVLERWFRAISPLLRARSGRAAISMWTRCAMCSRRSGRRAWTIRRKVWSADTCDPMRRPVRG